MGLGIKVKKRLEHVKTWLGRHFCCLVIYANLHNLPCICVKMAPTGTFFHFLVIVGIKGEKGSLAHDKTLFGRRFCCLVIYAHFDNLPCICVSLGIKVKKGILEHVKTWLGRRFCCLVIYANLHNLPCIYASNGSDGNFFHFSCD